VLKQCQKYGFVSLHQDLDRRIESRIYDWAHTVLSDRKHIPVASQPETYLVIDPNPIPVQAVRLFDLARSEDALASYLIVVIEENNSRIRAQRKLSVQIDRRKIDEAIRSISELVAQMRACGRYRMCSLLLQKMMSAQLCFPLDIANVEGKADRFSKSRRFELLSSGV